MTKAEPVSYDRAYAAGLLPDPAQSARRRAAGTPFFGKLRLVAKPLALSRGVRRRKRSPVRGRLGSGDGELRSTADRTQHDARENEDRSERLPVTRTAAFDTAR